MQRRLFLRQSFFIFGKNYDMYLFADAKKLIPQKYPIVMTDKLIKSDKEKTVTEFTVKKDNIFAAGGKLREPGIIENMAQTAAVRAGYEAYLKKEPVKTGFIASIKKLKIYKLPKTDETINTILTSVSNIENISVVRAETFVGNNKIAECVMTIILDL